MAKNKVGIAIEGGGIRGVYAAGVVDALMENNIYPDVIYGTSAGALVGANYAAKQKGRTVKLMIKAFHSPSFISPLNYYLKGNVFNFDWLFNKATKYFPFAEDVFYNSEIDFYATSTDCNKGKPIYWNKKDKEFYKGLASSCSLPLYTKKPIYVHDVPCLDGGLCERIPFHKMLEDEVPNIIVIATRPKGFRYGKVKESEIKKVNKKYIDYPNLLLLEKNNHDIFNAHMEELENLDSKNRVITIWPSKQLNIGFFELRKNKILAIYELGRNDAKTYLDKIKKTMH